MNRTLYISGSDHDARAGRPCRTAGWRRAAGVGLVTTLLSLGSVSAGAATTAGAPAPTSRVLLAEWRDGRSSSDWGQSGNPWGQSSSTTTVDSQPATAAQSRGVVLVDTVLGYQGAAAAGTGIVLTSDGEVLTNYHVVEGSTTIRVTIASSGKTYSATVVGHDQTDDIALLKLTGASGLATATVDDDTVSTGDRVSAVGNAGGTDSLTAADGTVTSLNETITTESGSGAAGETLDHLIATDADVVAGDSGGPLYDDEGEVIGIDTAASTGSEINGYAIPIASALSIVKQILAGDETGSVQIGASAFLGVQVTAANSSPSYDDSGYGYPGQDTSTTEPSGAVVAGVQENTPAATAGLETGDTITAVGGTTVTSADQLTTALQRHEPGDSVKLSWTDSSDDQHTVTVRLAASPVA